MLEDYTPIIANMSQFDLILLTLAVSKNINIYKQEDGSGTLTQREPITLVTNFMQFHNL